MCIAYATKVTALQAKSDNTEEYTMENARVLAITICHSKYTFIQTYSLKAGIKKFAEQGRKAALDEMKQKHDRIVVCHIRIDNISETEGDGKPHVLGAEKV